VSGAKIQTKSNEEELFIKQVFWKELDKRSYIGNVGDLF